MKKKLLVIIGPTATGKTDIALKIAAQLNGELISCDSRQVYKGLDIGTGKLPTNTQNIRIEKHDTYWIVNSIPIWLYDVADVSNQYTVANYVIDASRVVSEITKRGKLPIIVGGTGLYVRALLDGLAELEIPVNTDLRENLERLSKQELQHTLEKLSTETWDALTISDKENPRRLLRAIEKIYMYPYISKEKQFIGVSKVYESLKIGLTAPREVLYKNIDDRVLKRLSQGMIDESKKLINQGVSIDRLQRLGLEYGVLADYLEGKIASIEGPNSLISVMQYKIHAYARRQITWFKKEQSIDWFDITEHNYHKKIEKIVQEWYYKSSN